MNLYEQLKAAGCEIDNYHSDLYVRCTETALEIVRTWRHQRGHIGVQYSCFDAPDGSRWLDIPFEYTPWWADRIATSGLRGHQEEQD